MKVKKPKVSLSDSGKHMCFDQNQHKKSTASSVGKMSKRK